MITYEEFVKAMDTVLLYQKQIKETLLKIEEVVPMVGYSENGTLGSLNMTVRLYNILRYNQYDLIDGLEVDRSRNAFNDLPISCLSQISISNLRSKRIAGKKTIDEFKHICAINNIEPKP